MGFFSQGNYGVTDYLENVQADPKYTDSTAAYRTMVEGYENDRLFFEAMLDYDFQEASLIHESAGEGEMVALQENMITSFFSKLKELFKKLWSKIKAIFHGFIAKFSAKLGSDNKAFAKKYRKEIYRKNLTNFEAKYEKPKKTEVEAFITLGKAGTEVTVQITSTELSDIKTINEDWDDEEEEEKALHDLTGIDVDSVKDFPKIVHEHCFEDKDTIEGEAEVKAALTHLENANKTISDVNKANDKLSKCINNIIKDIDKQEKDVYKDFKPDDKGIYRQGSYSTSFKGKTGEKAVDRGTATTWDYTSADVSTDDKKKAIVAASVTDKEKMNNAFSVLSKRARVYQSAITKVTTACLKEAKFYIAQDRMLVAKAVAYRPKNESTELVSQEEMDFFGDIAAWEVETELR